MSFSRLIWPSACPLLQRYPTSRWDGLTLYADNGWVEMGSNTVERSIRLFALTRKNALFLGSARGGQTGAVTASLVQTRKLNGVDPQAYSST